MGAHGRPRTVSVRSPLGIAAMSLLHCPLCIGLAVLSVGRGLAHAALAWQLRDQLRPA